MASDEILRRIDEHIAQGNEHMARGNELMARIDEHMARGSELMEEIKREHELNRLAFAENARVMARLVEVLNRVDRRIEAQPDQIRVNTNAMVRLLNRLGNGGADPAPA